MPEPKTKTVKVGQAWEEKDGPYAGWWFFWTGDGPSWPYNSKNEAKAAAKRWKEEIK